MSPEAGFFVEEVQEEQEKIDFQKKSGIVLCLIRA